MKYYTRFLTCPFVLGCLSGITALIGDLFWLLFDTMIKTNDFMLHPFAYSTIGMLLLLGILLLLYGLIRYHFSGLEMYERKVEYKYLVKQRSDRRNKC